MISTTAIWAFAAPVSYLRLEVGAERSPTLESRANISSHVGRDPVAGLPKQRQDLKKMLSLGSTVTGDLPWVPPQHLPQIVVQLREYLLTHPGSGFRPSFELQRALGIDSKGLADMMRKLRVEPRVRNIYDDVAGRKRQVQGYDDADILAGIADGNADAA